MTVILYCLECCNALIAIVISFYKEIYFFGVGNKLNLSILVEIGSQTWQRTCIALTVNLLLPFSLCWLSGPSICSALSLERAHCQVVTALPLSWRLLNCPWNARALVASFTRHIGSSPLVMYQDQRNQRKYCFSSVNLGSQRQDAYIDTSQENLIDIHYSYMVMQVWILPGLIGNVIMLHSEVIHFGTVFAHRDVTPPPPDNDSIKR